MNDDTKQMMQETLAKISAEIARLQAVENTLRAALSQQAVKTAPRAIRGPRAPSGALEQAIREALKGRGGLVNREIRAKLVKAKYPYSLDPLHIGKALAAMAEAKELKLALKGNRREYSLK